MSSAGEGKQGMSRRRPDKPFIPFAKFEDIVARCGHTEKFGLLPDNKDRFRDDRRKKAMSRDCKACREKRQVEEQEALAKRRAEKEQRQAEAPPARKRQPAPARLPDGSRFEVSYDGTQQRWTGTLTIQQPGAEPLTFTGSGSGLFPLLSRLDEQYRATLS